MLTFPRAGKEIHYYKERSRTKSELITVESDPREVGHTGTFPMYGHFLDCVEQRKPAWLGPYVGKESIRIPIAAQLAATDYRVVEMNELPV